jgi:hypothetical protein
MTPEQKRKNLWETDIEEFLKQANGEDLTEYAKTFEIGKEIDYTDRYWGHSFCSTNEYGRWVHYGYGFYSKGSRVSKGDVLLLPQKGRDIGKYVVLHIRYCTDPRDMYFAYLACMGDKEKQTS